jgi:hypothetical protein
MHVLIVFQFPATQPPDTAILFAGDAVVISLSLKLSLS